MGHAGVGVFRLRGAHLSLPSIATVQFQRFFIVVGLLGVCFLWVVVGLCVWLFFMAIRGADRDAERLALTDQLLDAALGELGVVAREQPCLLVGDFNVEPPRFLAWQKESWLVSGLIWKNLGLWLLEGVLGLPVSRIWDLPSALVVILWWVALVAAAISGCEVLVDRWVVPHFAVRTCFDYSRWLARVSLPHQRSPLWPASWLPVLDNSRGSKAAEIQRVWDKK